MILKMYLFLCLTISSLIVFSAAGRVHRDNGFLKNKRGVHFGDNYDVNQEPIEIGVQDPNVNGPSSEVEISYRSGGNSQAQGTQQIPYENSLGGEYASFGVTAIQNSPSGSRLFENSQLPTLESIGSLQSSQPGDPLGSTYEELEREQQLAAGSKTYSRGGHLQRANLRGIVSKGGPSSVQIDQEQIVGGSRIIGQQQQRLGNQQGPVGTSQQRSGTGSPAPSMAESAGPSSAPLPPIRTTEVRTITQQVPVPIPQPYAVTVTKEVPVPKPYPVNIIKEVKVPVHIRVPFEVPKPYEVKVPHPVPVPVQVKVPVEIIKPYRVTVTKTVTVPVEKIVYVKVPHTVKVPVPQPYPVPVPQIVRVKVPTPVYVKDPEAAAELASQNLSIDGSSVQSQPAEQGYNPGQGPSSGLAAPGLDQDQGFKANFGNGFDDVLSDSNESASLRSSSQGQHGVQLSRPQPTAAYASASHTLTDQQQRLQLQEQQSQEQQIQFHQQQQLHQQLQFHREQETSALGTQLSINQYSDGPEVNEVPNERPRVPNPPAYTIGSQQVSQQQIDNSQQRSQLEYVQVVQQEQQQQLQLQQHKQGRLVQTEDLQQQFQQEHQPVQHSQQRQQLLQLKQQLQQLQYATQQSQATVGQMSSGAPGQELQQIRQLAYDQPFARISDDAIRLGPQQSDITINSVQSPVAYQPEYTKQPWQQ